MNNPYQSPDAFVAKVRPKSTPMLFWFSLTLIVLGAIVWVSVVASVLTDIVNGWTDNPAIDATVAMVCTILFGLICLPQFFSVFRGSLTWARITSWISIAGVLIGLTAAVVYPIVEYNFDFSPPGFEIIGAISYLAVAALFFANNWFHRTWIEQLRQTIAA